MPRAVERIWVRELGHGTLGSQKEGTVYPQDTSYLRCHDNQRGLLPKVMFA